MESNPNLDKTQGGEEGIVLTEEQKAKKSAERRQKQVIAIRKVIEEIYDQDRELENINNINSVLNEINEMEIDHPISERVNNPEETINDVQMCRTVSDLVLKSVTAVDNSTQPYRSREFGSRVTNMLNCEDITDDGAAALLDFATIALTDTPDYLSLHGTAEEREQPPAKLRMPRQKYVEPYIAEKKYLLNVDKSKSKEESIDDIMNLLITVLKEEYEKNNNQPIDYYEFVIDSSDFGESINNIFYTSFLIKDGKARLDVGENGRPNLMPVRSKELKEFRRNGGQNSQFIMTFDMDTWEKSGVKDGFLQRRKRLFKNSSK